MKWQDLEKEVEDLFDNALRTKGSGNKKGDGDVKAIINNHTIFFQRKSQDIPKRNIIFKENDISKAEEQAKVYYATPILIQRRRNHIPYALIKLSDFKELIT